jgi:hypothetical protein
MIAKSAIGNRKSEMIWLREKESNLHYCVQSAACYQLHHPTRILQISDFRLDLEFKVFQICNLKSEICNALASGEGFEPSSSDSKSNVLPVALSRKKNGLWSLVFGLGEAHRIRLVAAGGVEPPSLDYQSSALPLSYAARVRMKAEG